VPILSFSAALADVMEKAAAQAKASAMICFLMRSVPLVAHRFPALDGNFKLETHINEIDSDNSQYKQA